MKKIISLVMAVALVLSACSCGKNNDATVKKQTLVTTGFRTAAVKNDGSVVFATHNDRLGNYYEMMRNTEISKWTDVISISDDFYYALKSDGSILVAPCEKTDPEAYTVGKVEGAVALYSCKSVLLVLKKEGTVVAFDTIRGLDTSIPIKLRQIQSDSDQWRDIVQIEDCGDYILGVKSDGTIVSMKGTSMYTTLSESMKTATEWTGISSLKCKKEQNTSYNGGDDGTVFAVKKDGTVVYSTGKNHSYDVKSEEAKILNLESVKQWKNITDIAFCNGVASEWTIVVGLKRDGTVTIGDLSGDKYADEYYEYYDVDKWSDVVNIEAKEGTIVGLKSDGSIVCAGWPKDIDECRGGNIAEWKDIMLP